MRFKNVDLIYLTQNLAMESCMHGDGTLDYRKNGQFLESLSNCQLLKRDCSVWWTKRRWS